MLWCASWDQVILELNECFITSFPIIQFKTSKSIIPILDRWIEGQGIYFIYSLGGNSIKLTSVVPVQLVMFFK